MSEKLSQRFAKAVVKMREVQNNRYHTDHAVDVAILCDAAFDKILSALRLAESPSVAEGVEREREDALFHAYRVDTHSPNR